MPFDLDEQFIVRAEKALNIKKFPESYREFMKKVNGAYFELGHYENDEERDTDNDYVGFYLYPIADTLDKRRLKRTCNDVVRETKNARKEYGLSDEHIEIGNDGGAGIFLFKINSDRSVDETIWYRMHEDSDNDIITICKFSEHN